MVQTTGQQAAALSPANPGSSAAAVDSVAFPATNVASPGTKNVSAKTFPEGHDNPVAVTSCLDAQTGLNSSPSLMGPQTVHISNATSNARDRRDDNFSGSRGSGSPGVLEMSPNAKFSLRGPADLLAHRTTGKGVESFPET